MEREFLMFTRIIHLLMTIKQFLPLLKVQLEDVKLQYEIIFIKKKLMEVRVIFKLHVIIVKNNGLVVNLILLKIIWQVNIFIVPMKFVMSI